MAWANPDTSSAVTYDGVQGRLIAQVTSGDSSGTRPIVEVFWDDSTSGVYDIVPTT